MSVVVAVMRTQTHITGSAVISKNIFVVHDFISLIILKSLHFDDHPHSKNSKKKSNRLSQGSTLTVVCWPLACRNNTLASRNLEQLAILAWRKFFKKFT